MSSHLKARCFHLSRQYDVELAINVVQPVHPMHNIYSYIQLHSHIIGNLNAHSHNIQFFMFLLLYMRDGRQFEVYIWV
jgi:hypothetical protein